MTDRQALIALAAKIEAADGPSRELDAEIAIATDPRFSGWIRHPYAKGDSPDWMKGEIVESEAAFKACKIQLRPVIRTTEYDPCPFLWSPWQPRPEGVRKMFYVFPGHTDYVLLRDNEPYRAWRFDHDPA